MNNMKEDKKAKIKQAVYQLVAKEGLIGISMSKIAKQAGVVPSNIYVYYENKTDLLSSIYREAKLKIDGNLAAILAQEDTIQGKIRATATLFAKSAFTFKDEYVYMMAVNSNMEVLDEATKRFTQEMGAPLFELGQQIIDSPDFKKLTFDQIVAFSMRPVQQLAYQRDQQFTDKELDFLVQIIVDALSV